MKHKLKLLFVLSLLSLTAFAQDPFVIGRDQVNQVSKYRGGIINDSISKLPVRGHEALYPDVQMIGRQQVNANDSIYEYHNGTEWVKLRRVFKTVEDYGAVAGDGIDDTEAFQAAFDDLQKGDVLLCDCKGLPYSTNADMTFTQTDVIIDGKGCAIVEEVLTTATITGSGAHNSVIKNFRFYGTENLENWEAGNTAYRSASRSFARFLNSNNSVIDHNYGEAKRELAKLQNCDDSKATDNYQQGFFGDILVNTNVSDVQYARCVSDTQGRYNQITGNSAYQTGAIVTLSQGGFHNIENNHGEELHDNGIYNSSCPSNNYIGNHIQWVKGSGIKSRSDKNVIHNNILHHVGSGISVSGEGTIFVDSYNSNGRYSEITNNEISDIFTESAISINIQDGYYSRDTRITGNNIYEHDPVDPSSPAVRILSVKGIDYSHNTIHDSSADIALLWNGTVSAPQKNNIFCNNQFYLCKETVRLTYFEESIVTGNIFKDCSTGITGRYVNNSLFENNKSFNLTGSYGLLLDPVYSCNNNKLFNNDNVSGSTSTSLNTVISDGSTSGTRALISQTITNGVTTHSPSEDVVFDNLALKAANADVIGTKTTSTGYTGTIFAGDMNALAVGNFAQAISNSVTNGPSGIGTPRSFLRFGARNSTDNTLSSDIIIGTTGIAYRNNTNTAWITLSPTAAPSFSGSVTLSTAPTTSAGSHDIVTRNTSTGIVEKIASSTYVTATSILTGSATLDFPDTAAQTSSELTITVTGAADGDVVSVGVPNVSTNANSCFTARVSATNTVTVKFNNYSSGSINPASGTFKVKVLK